MAARSSSLISMVAQIQNVRLSFDGFVSLALDLDLEINRGEVFGLIGPPGSGKSITLMLLAGRLRPMEGKVKVFGRSPRWSAVRARIGYLPQNSRPSNHPGLLGRMVRKFQRAAKPAPAAPNGQRVELLLLKNPDLMILDDPFADLDPAGALAMKDRIRDMARRGKTVVLCARFLPPAQEVCNRLAILFRGRIEAIGSLDDLLHSPDAIRLIGPVLPPAAADKVLTTMREQTLGAGVPVQPSKPSPLPDSEPHESQMLANLTRPNPADAASSAPCSVPADPVNHEKLTQLTKPGSGTTHGT